MRNDFVDYLNSMNNASSNSVNALAESQVVNEYYKKIKIDIRLGDVIADSIRKEEHAAYILTGHAGDGKTSILVQVLQRLGLLQPNEYLSVEKQYESYGSNLYYVKDMSEIEDEQQKNLLRKTLCAPKNNSSSILISNTGPLLHAFKSMVEEDRKLKGEIYSSEDRDSIENIILTQMDLNEDTPIKVGGYLFYLINLARIDNVNFAAKVIEKIIDEDLWDKCELCNKRNYCPFIKNVTSIRNQYNRVTQFITYFYRWLYENDKKMTVRQILSHISYSLTGNLNCEDIKLELNKPLFRYNFANLFFGYIGINEDANATQIKGIRQIKNADIDRIAVREDYNLFVKNDRSFFNHSIRSILEDAKLYLNSDEARRAIRRFYLIYGRTENEYDLKQLVNQLYGPQYASYIECITEGDKNDFTDELSDLLFKTLYFVNCGTMPENDDLYLTLRRKDEVYQNVMIVLAKLDKEDIEVKLRTINSKFADKKYELVVELSENSVPLTYPLVSYFDSIVRGEVVSNNNPVLTHGIDKLNSMLYKAKVENTDDKTIRILTNTKARPLLTRIAIKDSEIKIK